MVLRASRTAGISWGEVLCAADAQEMVPEGTSADIGRFPWLGIVQHEFVIGDNKKYAVTTGVLIHPAYAVAPADDISKIRAKTVTTKFIVWRSDKLMYSIDVREYSLHPDYLEGQTRASLALLELRPWGQTGLGETDDPVFPVCMPVTGSGVYTDMYAVRVTDENGGKLEKEVMKMNYVDKKLCDEFYEKAKLSQKNMAPSQSVCAVSAVLEKPCVFDAGVVLVARQNWGYWKLLGFGVRGPGCGAPARFVDMNAAMEWLDEVITRRPFEDTEGDNALVLRRMSPTELVMYPSDMTSSVPKETGQCSREMIANENMLYKDSSELTINRDFGQGFYFVSISQAADFSCVKVNLHVLTRTNAAIWLEHQCNREDSNAQDLQKVECFLYFKSMLFLEFRFTFAFKASVEVSIYGKPSSAKSVPNPFDIRQTTDRWWPTVNGLQWGNFVPLYMYWYWM